MPRWGRSQERSSDQKPSIEVTWTSLESVAVIIAGVFALGMADGLVSVAPVFQTSIDVVLVGMDQGALGDGLLDDGLDCRLLDIGQHLEDDLPTALDQAQDRWFLLLQGAAIRGAFQPTPPAPPLFSTSAGWP